MFRIGLAAVVGVFLTAVWGVAAKYCSGFIKNYIRPINTKLYHATLALVVFCLGMAAICLACYSNWVRRRVDGYFWRLMFFTPIVLAVCMARQVSDLFIYHFFLHPGLEKTRIQKKLSSETPKEMFLFMCFLGVFFTANPVHSRISRLGWGCWF